MTVFQQALANDPTLATAESAKRATDQDVPIARAELLPQASLEQNLTDTHGGATDSTTEGHLRSRSLTGTITQNVVNLADIAALKEAKTRAQAGSQTYQAALLDLYERIVEAYLNVLIAQDQVKTYNAYEEAYQREYEQTSSRLEQGLSSQMEKNQALAYYQYVKSQRIGVENSLQQAQQALNKITGRQSGELRKLREDIPMPPPTPANAKAWVDIAQDHNPTIIADGLSINAAEQAVSAARAGHLPTLQASVIYSRNGNWYTRMPGDSGYGHSEAELGLSLNFPIFSGGLVHAQVHKAIAGRDEASAALEVDRRQVEYDVRINYQRLVQGVAQIEAAKLAVKAAKETLKFMEIGYGIGTQNLTSVVVAIGALADTQEQYSSVRHQYVLDSILLRQAAGVLSIKDLEEINRWLQ